MHVLPVLFDTYHRRISIYTHIPQFGETLFRIVGNAGTDAYITCLACFNGNTETNDMNSCSKHPHFCDLSFL
jgi:hypothetical protein